MALFVTAPGEPDDDFATIIGIALSKYEFGLLQSVEDLGNCPGRQPREIRELPSRRRADEIQDVQYLHIRNGYSHAGRCYPKEGRVDSSELPGLPQKRLTDSRTLILSIT